MKNLTIPNPEKFKEKINRIKKDGFDRLHIISDFDRTLTTKSTHTSWSLFTNKLGSEYNEARQKLFEHYYPIEQDHSLDSTYRLEKMNEWWEKHLQLLIKNKLSRENIEKIIDNENIELRESSAELLNFIHNHKIPLLIFSAGIGDAIKIFLKKHFLLNENIHILSNFFTFDINDGVSGFENEIIHSLNKNETVLKKHSFMEEIVSKPNCILFGDTIPDASMSDGLSHNTVIKIGFLNRNENIRSEFERVYDAFFEDEDDLNMSELFG